MNDFKPTQVVRMDGKDYPIYDLNKKWDFILKFEDIPEQIQKQVDQNCSRISDRLEVNPNIDLETPVAIVGYGPTLKEAEKYLNKFKVIFSTSGAHKFLIDRDIIPTYHVEVDFREHKAIHTRESHPDVDYLFASIVHPKLLDNVTGKRTKLWHLEIDSIKYPKEDLVLASYWDVGQGAVTVAKAMGYRNLHLFGFDYAFEASDDMNTHAGYHNGAQGSEVFAKVGNKLFHTSDRLVRGMLSFTQLMKDHTDLSLTLYSDGLLSEYLQLHHKEV